MPRALQIFLVLAAAAYGLSGFYIVRPEQRGVVRRFGRALAETADPGLHYHWPAPIGKITRVNATEERRLSIGFEILDSGMGRTADPTQLHYVTGDLNIVSIEAAVQYTIADPKAYTFRAVSPEALLEAAAAGVLSEACAELGVDFVLTDGKTQIQNRCRQSLQERADMYGLGIEVRMVLLQSVAPPMAVIDKFNDVVAAKEERNARIQEALKHGNRVGPEARGAAARTINESEAYREGEINRARGESARFTKLARAAEGDGGITLRRLYMETMSEVLPKLRMNVIGPENGGVTIGITESAGSITSPRP